MKDALGNELHVNDKVIFTMRGQRRNGGGYGLMRGTIETIASTGYSCTIKSNDYKSYSGNIAHGVTSNNVLKYNWPETTDNT